MFGRRTTSDDSAAEKGAHDDGHDESVLWSPGKTAARKSVEALLLESNLIKRHRPAYNVRLRDDTHYPYICLKMDEPFPRPVVVRRARKDGNRYFGPYTSSWSMRQALRVIKAVFKLRGCARVIKEHDTQRLCLDYHLGLCSGPCAGPGSQERCGALWCRSSRNGRSGSRSCSSQSSARSVSTSLT